MSFWPSLSSRALDRKTSDHRPILLENMVVDFGPKPFRFFDAWLHNSKISLVEENAWKLRVDGMFPDAILMAKFRNVKVALRRWASEKFGKVKEEIIKAKGLFTRC